MYKLWLFRSFYVLLPSGYKEQMSRLHVHTFFIGFFSLFIVFFELYQHRFVMIHSQFIRDTLKFAIGRMCGTYRSLAFCRCGIVWFWTILLQLRKNILNSDLWLLFIFAISSRHFDRHSCLFGFYIPWRNEFVIHNLYISLSRFSCLSDSSGWTFCYLSCPIVGFPWRCWVFPFDYSFDSTDSNPNISLWPILFWLECFSRYFLVWIIDTPQKCSCCSARR